MDYHLQYNLSGLPEDIQKQVKDFIEFLLSKRESPRGGKKTRVRQRKDCSGNEQPSVRHFSRQAFSRL
jgi:hypothetical protein